MDGSFEEWLEDRGPRGCLIHMVDDATSTSLGRFEDEETTWGVADTLRACAVRADVREAGDRADRGQLTAGQRPRAARPRHAPGPADKENAAAEGQQL